MPSWSTPPTFVAGNTLTAAQLNTYVSDNTTHLYDLTHDAWASYSPTWGGTGVSIGNGSLTGAYAQVGKLVFWRIFLNPGSTTNFGSGSWTFTVPVTPISVTSFLYPIGTYSAIDTGTAEYTGICRLTAAGATTFDLLRDGSPFRVTAAVPFTWADADFLACAGTYEAA